MRINIQMQKAIVGVLILLSAFSLGTAAQPSQELTIGDEVPDIEIKNVINYSTPTIKLSNLRGKLVILNFWATWCSPCVAGFPKLDSLQKRFQKDIQILNITNENRKKVTSFFESMKSIKNLNPVTVVSDRVLASMFYHNSLPHYIWINKDGRVVAITDGNAITNGNIEDAIAEKGKTLEKKVDNRARLGRSNGLIFTPTVKVNNNGTVFLQSVQEEDLIFNSTFTFFQEGAIGGGMNKPTFVSLTNTSISNLYRAAFWKFGLELLNQNNTVVEVGDSLLYEIIKGTKNNKSSGQTPEEINAWRKKNLFCYELKVPAQLTEKKFDIMADELNRYFGVLYGIEGVKEKRNSKCLILTRTTTEDKIAAKGNISSENTNKFLLDLKNADMRDFVVNLKQSLLLYPPIIDETNYKGKIDIRINCQLTNLKAVNAELDKYGLQLIEQDRMIDMVVIKKREPKLD